MWDPDLDTLTGFLKAKTVSGITRISAQISPSVFALYQDVPELETDLWTSPLFLGEVRNDRAREKDTTWTSFRWDP